jgi:hypothetical protein
MFQLHNWESEISNEKSKFKLSSREIWNFSSKLIYAVLEKSNIFILTLSFFGAKQVALLLVSFNRIDIDIVRNVNLPISLVPTI